ncbi:hypothetical protein HY489_01980 [Candidatus Woesearchaeota archaeon]|nr:hypothetical protein [Candidatus Woesearchaeota archaeon]
MSGIAPLKTSFMVASMIGFLVSVLYVPQFSRTWALAFGLVFIAMFVASLISMMQGPPDEQLFPARKRLH